MSRILKLTFERTIRIVEGSAHHKPPDAAKAVDSDLGWHDVWKLLFGAGSICVLTVRPVLVFVRCLRADANRTKCCTKKIDRDL